MERLDSHAHSESLDLALGYIYAQWGRIERLADWLRKGKVDTLPHGTGLRRPFALVVYGKSLVAAGEFKLLGPVARTMPQRFGRYGSLVGRMHAKVLEAFAAKDYLGVCKALDPMRSAVDLARADSLVFSIAEYGLHVLPLLRRLHREKPEDNHLARVTALADDIHRNAPYGMIRRKNAHPLSLREQTIMRCVTHGLSNAAIARELGITESGVKKSLLTIYGKLGVSNRAEATQKFGAIR